MRVLCSGKTLAFQANDASSILATRSISCKSVALSSWIQALPSVYVLLNLCQQAQNGLPFGLP